MDKLLMTVVSTGTNRLPGLSGLNGNFQVWLNARSGFSSEAQQESS